MLLAYHDNNNNNEIAFFDNGEKLHKWNYAENLILKIKKPFIDCTVKLQCCSARENVCVGLHSVHRRHAQDPHAAGQDWACAAEEP